MKKLLYVLTSLCLLAGLFTGCEKPEKESEKATSTIKGVVTDKETGNPLSNVTIEIQPTGKQVQTAEDGAYIFENLKAGTYALKAQKDGYDDYENAEILLGVEQTLTLDIEMEEQSVEFQTTDVKGNVIEEMECDAPECSFKLANIGNIAGEWSIETETVADWLTELNPKSGTLSAGTSEIIAFKRKLLEEDKETVITIKTEKEDLQLKIINKGFVMEMVYVVGGEFEMGATEEQGDDVSDNEKPVRNINLDSYYIGKYEVTQAQWKAVMGTDPSEFKGDNLPVEQVNWEEAQAFCKKLSEATGKTYCLPTEAQWEYAARGGNKSQHYKYAGSDDIDEVAWYRELGNSERQTHPVGTKKANELGIYDMSGNVWEWCSDWYDTYDENDTDNPQGPTNGSGRVGRGGGWYGSAKFCRLSHRNRYTPGTRYDYLGFRVACSL